jgi:transposase
VPECGHENAAEMKFCGECGTRLTVLCRECGARNAPVARKLRRKEVLAFFAKLPPCLVGMEACGSAHFWAREISRLGHTVKLNAAEVLQARQDGCG